MFENFKKETEETIEKLRKDYESILNEKEVITNTLNSEINNIKSECDQLKTEKDSEIKTLNDKYVEQEAVLRLQSNEKDESISKMKSENELLKTELEELRILKSKEKEEMDLLISQKEKERQVRILTQCGDGEHLCRIIIKNHFNVSSSTLIVYHCACDVNLGFNATIIVEILCFREKKVN